jgi:hypothetical protein
MRNSNFNKNQNLILSIISEIAEEPPINNKEVKIYRPDPRMTVFEYLHKNKLFGARAAD